MTKKVIFVGGTSYSGSTFFHLTLANDARGFAVGEVSHLFRPVREKHMRATWACGCKDPHCDVWPRVKAGGEQHLYESIFDARPEVDFVVDASKNVVWIAEQTEHLLRRGIEVQNVLIWKTLLEYAHSLHKRERLSDGGELHNWARYHRNYYSFVDAWRAVRYADYIHHQAAVLQAACAHLDIPYFEGKERYWEKTHHALGGGLSARLHLYARDSEQYQDVQRRVTRGERKAAEAQHRQVYYEQPQEDILGRAIAAARREDSTVDRVEEMLAAYDIANPAPTGDWPDVRLSAAEMRMRRLRQHTKETLNRIKFGLQGTGAGVAVASQPASQPGSKG